MIEDHQVADLQNVLLALSARMSSLEVKMDKIIENANTAVVRHLEDSSSENIRISDGDTAWILYSTGLIIFMTIPGLAIFYAGMARVRNVLATVMQVASICVLITFLWICFGYSLSFGPPSADSKGNSVIGNGDRLWLQGMTLETAHQLAPNLPESVFCSFQLAFAIMTASLICTSIAHKFRYIPMLLFISIWHFVVYCPTAHSVWHPDGFLFKAGVLDWAGGYVVHITSGVSTLVCAIVVGKTTTRAHQAHNILYSFIGCCILWMGWYGFNAGSAYSADSRASTTLLNTQISASLSGLSWMAVEWIKRGKPSVLGMCSHKHHGRRLLQLAHLRGKAYAVKPGHGHIKKQQIARTALQACHCLRCTAGLAQHLDGRPRAILHQGSHAQSGKGLIVHDQNAQGVGLGGFTHSGTINSTR